MHYTLPASLDAAYDYFLTRRYSLLVHSRLHDIKSHPIPSNHHVDMPLHLTALFLFLYFFFYLDMFEDMNEINDLMGRSYAAPDGLDEVRNVELSPSVMCCSCR